MKRKRASRPRPAKEPEHGAELARLHAKSDADIETGARADRLNPPLTEAELRVMDLALPASKQLISLRLDRSVVEWFKRQGAGYQTRMNAVLRGYMQAKGGRAAPLDPIEVRIAKIQLKRQGKTFRRDDFRRGEPA